MASNRFNSILKLENQINSMLKPVTSNELLEYYQQNNITTFVKTANGRPDMRNKTKSTNM